jgi:hypothetical protein
MNRQRNIAQLKIEMHHTPFKIVEITRTVCNKHIMHFGHANEFDVVNEVLLLHYRNLIGLIPVTNTVHELIHNADMDVCPNFVWGHWKAYIHDYYPYFDNISKEKCEIIRAWEISESSFTVPDILKVQFSVIEHEGVPLWRHPLLYEKDHAHKQIEYKDSDIVKQSIAYLDDLLKLAS